MRRRTLCLAMALVGLAGCQRAEEAVRSATPKPQGRYQGVGVYLASDLWGQLARSDAPDDPKAARLDDDSHLIVVVDAVTGEVRQCGNLSGHCIAMNPWSKPASAEASLPVPLLKHAADLREEAEAKAEVTVEAGR